MRLVSPPGRRGGLGSACDYLLLGLVVDSSAEEGQQLAVDLLGVGHAHDVRPALDLDVMGVGEGGVEAAALALDRQDPVGGPVQDQGRDVDPLMSSS